MAVGSRDNSKNVVSETGHSKAELYSNSTLSWKKQMSFSNRVGIQAFQIMTHLDYFIIFGGLFTAPSGNGETPIIAKFNPSLNKWSKMGSLRYRRNAFGIIEVDKKVLVMGGHFDKSTEICEITDATIKCSSRKPIMTDFIYYPAMMIVPSDFSKNC